MKTKRTLAEFKPLNAAEQKIVDEIDNGEFTEIGGGSLPDENAGEGRKVRASFIRYLALGGCKACKIHETGLQIDGALIEGVLDLEGGDLPFDLGLFNCRFDHMPVFQSATLKNLFRNGSFLPKDLSGGRLEAKGSVLLRDVDARGAVRLLGAKLGGNLDCEGARFNAPQGQDGTPTDFAFSADGLEAKGAFFLRKGAEIKGEISLAGTAVRALSDEPGCWPQDEDSISIDRFHYGAILGGVTPVDAETRLKWLAKIRHINGFSPQPYEQLAKVLREMGHREDARVVMIEKERLQREAQNPSWWRRIWNRVMRVSAGYGYRPSLSIYWLLGLWLWGALVFGLADLNGSIKPNSDRIWDQKEWKDCEGAAPSQKWCYLVSDVGEGYPIFNPFIYSADTLLPIVDLEMQGAWIPDERAGWVGIGSRLHMWLHIALGWFFSLLAVAGFSGLIKPE